MPTTKPFASPIVSARQLLLARLLLALALALTGLGALPRPVQAANAIIHVKPTGAASGTCGSTWTAPCGLQRALQLATSTDQIWVAAGTYKPTTGTDRAATFQLKSGVAIYGGFAGSETALNQRDWTTNIVILSGDLSGNDGENFTNNGENSYHVVTGANNATLDGVTIRGGNANDDVNIELDRDRGGGIFNNNCSPTLSNVTFSGNTATSFGGGMYNNDSSSPTLTNVTFSGNTSGAGGGMKNTDSSNPTLTNVTFYSNSAAEGGGMYNEASSPKLNNVTFNANTATSSGGGMYNRFSSNPTLTGVTLSSNSARDGGGMYNNDSSSPTLANVTLRGNTASNAGGGMYNKASSPTLANVVISGNAVGNYGGGMFNEASSPLLTNVTFSGNTAMSSAGGIYNLSDSHPTVRNSILWGDRVGANASEIVNVDTSSAAVTYSDVQGGYGAAADHNIDADPLFVAAVSPAPNIGGNLHLKPASPAINAGDPEASGLPATDLDGKNRKMGTVDMGPYEWHPLFVNDDAPTAPHDGSSWANAYLTLQDALTAAGNGDQIWVATGTYTPVYSTPPADPRTQTFQLKNGVAIYGGFDGVDDTAFSDRNVTTNVVILSGDLSGNDGADFANNDENSYHVVTGDNNATLDGVTVRGGNANGADSSNSGGGMYNDSSNPTVSNVTFTGNKAVSGGGMYNDSSELVVNSVTFVGNAASYGGGIYNRSSNTSLTNVIVKGNTVTSSGGGIYNIKSSPSLTNVIFIGNTATINGGGLFNEVSSPSLTNVIFIGNTASNGGGMANHFSSSPTLTNVTISGNTASTRAGGMDNRHNSNPTVRNSILWGDRVGTTVSEIVNVSISDATITYSNVEGGYTGAGNINEDPMFVNAAAGDLHLIDTSPAINAGKDADTTAVADLDGKPRKVATVDMGVYENQTITVSLFVNISIVSTLDTAQLIWHTNQELNVTGFNLYRAETANGERTLLTSAPIPVKDTKSGEVYAYDFTDTTAQPSRVYYYWVQTIHTNGTTRIFGPQATPIYSVFLPVTQR